MTVNEKFIEKLRQVSRRNNSLLSVGLDPDLNRSPFRHRKGAIFYFNRAIIDATHDLVCAFKPNLAFYEQYGLMGLRALYETIEYIGGRVPVILDAKRGDIEPASRAYARAIFDEYRADATTVNPYLGHDSVKPFLEYRDRGVFVLCLTSNPGRRDFQLKGGKELLYKSVARRVLKWNRQGNCGLVVGATSPRELGEVRKIIGAMPILVPGIGTQGGNLRQVLKAGLNREGEGLLINVSRAVIYAGAGKDFARASRAAARGFRDEINRGRGS